VNPETPAVVAVRPAPEWLPGRRDPALTQRVRAFVAQAKGTELRSSADRPVNVALSALVAGTVAGLELRGAPGDADLGAASRLLSRLSQASQGDHVAAPVISAAPLAAGPQDVHGIAQGLKGDLGSSGLFYESHLAQWVDGTVSKAELLREPQAALADGASPAAAAGQTTATGALALSPRAETLVQRQLETFEQRAVNWQGQPWPGQAAGLTIAEDDPKSRAGSAAERTWQASLRLSMPGLGDLEARIGLSGNKASLVLATRNPASSALLLRQRSDLARRLGENGLRLIDVRVGTGEGDG
jgi:hypothetical protein